jgi:hypothetical protein
MLRVQLRPSLLATNQVQRSILCQITEHDSARTENPGGGNFVGAGVKPLLPCPSRTGNGLIRIGSSLLNAKGPSRFSARRTVLVLARDDILTKRK